jgi:hypothetical protein
VTRRETVADEAIEETSVLEARIRLGWNGSNTAEELAAHAAS